jgi:hypothetical protein
MPADATDRRSVLAGTDWPIFTEQIFNEQYVPQRLQEALGACGLNAAGTADDRLRQCAEVDGAGVTQSSHRVIAR